jgi:hypothetical protein
MSIAKPIRPTDYPNRAFDCQLALSTRFRSVIECLAAEAGEAGWRADETTRAIVGLVPAYAADQQLERVASVQGVKELFLQ